MMRGALPHRDTARDDDRAEAEGGPVLSRRHIQWLWPALGLAAVALLFLAVKICGELLEGESFAFDSTILVALRQPGHLGTPIGPAWLSQSATDLSALGGFTLMWLFGAAGLGFLFWIGRRAEAAWIGASLIGASLLNTGLKDWLQRPRPEVVPHLTQVANTSFPSGHAMISAALYLTLGMMMAEAEPKVGRRVFLVGFAAVLVVLIGASRVYLGVHWPSDVLAGWCFGAVWALVVFAANRWLKTRAPASSGPTAPALRDESPPMRESPDAASTVRLAHAAIRSPRDNRGAG